MQLVHESRPQVRRDRLLRLPEVEQATGLKKSTIYLLMRRGEFPRCVQITPRCVAWPESAVLQWVQERIADAQAGSGQADAPGEAEAAARSGPAGKAPVRPVALVNHAARHSDAGSSGAGPGELQEGTK